MFANVGILHKLRHLIPIIPVYFIIITVIYVFTYYYALELNYGIIKTIIVPIFYFNAIMVLICHNFAMWTSPGYLKLNQSQNQSEIIRQDQPHLFCKKCVMPRPERTHHCKVCMKCVFKMDHHCPWVANCVGLYNQKYFYQFLFYATFGDFIAFCCLVYKFSQYDIQSLLNNKKFTTATEIFIVLKEPLLIIFAGFLAFAMTVSIGFLFAMQTKCLMYNFTTIEEKLYKNVAENPWYNYDKLNNLKSVLGASWYLWLFPIKINSHSSNEYATYDSESGKKTTSNGDNYLSLCEEQLEEENNVHITLNLHD